MTIVFTWVICIIGTRPEHGVPDMTVISDIDVEGINQNLHVRYDRDDIYVSCSLLLTIHYCFPYLFLFYRRRHIKAPRIFFNHHKMAYHAFWF